MDWYKKESIICNVSELDAKVNSFIQQYQTNAVLLKHQPYLDRKYCVEVWLNFNSQMHVINIHEYEEGEAHE